MGNFIASRGSLCSDVEKLSRVTKFSVHTKQTMVVLFLAYLYSFSLPGSFKLESHAILSVLH